MEITITRDGKVLYLATPYHPDLPAKAKAIGGKFDRPTKAWRFDARDEARVRALAVEIFGTTGDDSPELVTLRVAIGQLSLSRGQKSLFFAGREVAHRYYRDSYPSLGDGVVVVESDFPQRGGSMKYPTLDPAPDCVVEIRDVPRPAAERALAEYPDETTIVSVDQPAGCPLQAVFEQLDGDSRMEALVALVQGLSATDRVRLVQDAGLAEVVASKQLDFWK